MRDLTPNSPAGRFEHILKVYWAKKAGEGVYEITLDGVILDVFEVTLSLVGAEQDVDLPSVGISHETGDISVSFPMHEMTVERLQKALDWDTDFEKGRRERGERPPPVPAVLPRAKEAKAAREMLVRLGQPYEYNDQGIISWGSEEWALASVVLQVVKLPAHSPPDFLVPWIARELVKIAKAIADAGSDAGTAVVDRDGHQIGRNVSNRDYYEAVKTLIDKAPAIAQWVKESRTDIGKVDLAEALEAISTYKFKQSLVEQGPVVYRFKDGWTVQELRTNLALAQEGKNMQNCVGGYCATVESGRTRIYSVRDPAGQPHVTLELLSPGGHSLYGGELSPEAFIKSEQRLSWYFAQILGKQNYMPIDEYQIRAREFIDRVFNKEGLGWCMTGGTPKWGRFSGRSLEGVDFSGIIDTNHVSTEVLEGADFSSANLTMAQFNGLQLQRTNFSRSNVSEADFRHSNLTEAKFEGTTCHFTQFGGTTLRSASFDSAHAGAAHFENADLTHADFRAASVDGAIFHKAVGGIAATWEGVELTSKQKADLRLELKGTIGKGKPAGE